MVSALLATAAALLCWPGRRAAARLRSLVTAATRPHQRRIRWRPGVPILIGAVALLALAVFGIGVAVAVAVAGVTAQWLWRSRRRVNGELSSAAAMADAVHGLVAELRSGAHPVLAAESAAKDAREPARAVLTSVAATARLGGDLAPALDRFATEHPTLAPVLRPFVHAWSLANRHGLPLADVLDAVGRDVTSRVRFAQRVRARMAGPRASGTVLAVLPVLGVLLGSGMGADPVRVLCTGSFGQLLLVVGTTLICAGLLWVTKLTSRAVW